MRGLLSSKSIQLYIEGKGSLHFNNLDFSIFLTPTDLLLNFQAASFLDSHFELFDLTSSNGGSCPPLLLSNHRDFSPFQLFSWGGSASIDSPHFWLNILCRLDEGGRGRRLRSSPLLFLGGAECCLNKL